MGLQEYLAQNYLSADTKPSKKRKRKEAEKATGLSIAEDDVNSWTNPTPNADEDENGPTIVGGTLGGGQNKTTKKTKWLRVGTIAPKDSEQAAADAILADAQAESQARAQRDDDDPAIVEQDEAGFGGPTMASGAMAGLQTAAQVTKALKRKQKEEMKAMKAAGLDAGGLAQQTIYRDASGRMINVKQKKEEANAKAREEERKQKEEEESRRGDVQRREKGERIQALEEAKVMTVARGVDDTQMNEELKERQRWNDPMAQLLATKKSSTSKGGNSKSKSSATTYQGAFEPNRYGIRPGWRWDGVDRGNGFERKWFAARNKQRDRQALEYAWEVDQ